MSIKFYMVTGRVNISHPQTSVARMSYFKNLCQFMFLFNERCAVNFINLAWAISLVSQYQFLGNFINFGNHVYMANIKTALLTFTIHLRNNYSRVLHFLSTNLEVSFNITFNINCMKGRVTLRSQKYEAANTLIKSLRGKTTQLNAVFFFHAEF